MTRVGIVEMGVILLVLLFVLLIIAGVVVVIWMLIRAGRGQSGATGQSGAPGGQTPLDILRARYASGEITRDQFEAMRRDLET